MAGWTCCGWVLVARATVTGPCHVLPPSGEKSIRISDWEFGSPLMALVEELNAMNTLPSCATVLGWVISRVALRKAGSERRPPRRSDPACSVRRKPALTPQSLIVPGVTFGIAVAGAPVTLKFERWNV